MARIPEDVVERLKREVSLERLAESSGLMLKRHGDNLMVHPGNAWVGDAAVGVPRVLRATRGGVRARPSLALDPRAHVASQCTTSTKRSQGRALDRMRLPAWYGTLKGLG